MQILGGKIVTVWPEAYAEAKYVFPQPAKFEPFLLPPFL
jgi:hypothetical protein